MPEIKFPSEWLKIGVNVEPGDVVQFLDNGVLDEDTERYIFNVAVFRGGELVEPTKKFNLNKTNFNAIKGLYGTNSDAWVQKEMRVALTKVRNPQTGGMVDSIGLEAPDVK